MDPLTYLLATLAGFAAGFIGSVVGGGGLISIPALMFLGLPPVQAIATSRFGTIGLFATAIPKYNKAKKVNWKLVPPIFLIYAAAAFIGANITLSIDQDILSKAIGVIILAVLIVLMLKPEIGVKKRKSNKPLGYLLSFFVGGWGGFFGGGYGILARYVFTIVLGLPFLNAVATSLIAGLGIVVTSLAVFALAGVIQWDIGIAMGIGFLLGGFAGPRIAIKKGDAWVRRLFIAFVIASAVKLLLF
ncbi:sulfite exporter TauE/SafE family protein [archaeon]